MTKDDIIELIAQLRAMARCEHEDMTVASDAADAMHEMLSRIAILEKALQPLADMYLYPDDFGADMAASIREDEDWDETTNDEATHSCCSTCAERSVAMKDIVDRLLTENTMHSYYDSPAIQVEAAQEIKRLRAEIERLRSALRFYAEPYKYTDIHGDDIQVPDFYSETDFGETARLALEGKP
jgi:hypothetical protein